MSAWVYRDRRWRTIRAAILARDHHTCQLKLPGCRHRANSVDHTIDWRDGGAPFDPTNLRAACMSCQVAQRNHRVANRARKQRDERTSRPW